MHSDKMDVFFWLLFFFCTKESLQYSRKGSVLEVRTLNGSNKDKFSNLI